MLSNNKLVITSLRKLKITKVKDWAIYFTYDNEKYLLHGSSLGYDDFTYKLYKRIPMGYNFELQNIYSEWTNNDYVKGEFIKEHNKRTLVYNQIDKEYFVNKLVDWKFAEYKPLGKQLTKEKKDILKSYCGSIKSEALAEITKEY